MWNSSPGEFRISQYSCRRFPHGLTRLARSVEPWEEDNAARIAGGFGIGDLEEVTVVKPFVARVASSMGCCGFVAVSSRALSTLVPTPQTYRK